MKRLTIEEKRLKGTLNSTRARQYAEIEFPNIPEDEIWTAPEDLSEDGKVLWYKITRQLSSLGVLFASCYEYIQAYCQLYQIMNEALADFEKENLSNDAKSKARAKVCYQVYKKSLKLVMQIGSKLGLTPLDQTRAKIKAKAK